MTANIAAGTAVIEKFLPCTCLKCKEPRININKSCIEMPIAWMEMPEPYRININKRCIEISDTVLHY